jgi:hypothetical protein
MAPPRKPKIEFYWSLEKKSREEIRAERAADKAKGIIWPNIYEGRLTRDVINWRLVGANNEVMCQSTQGFLDRASARESVARCRQLLDFDSTRMVGPGVKPS